MSLEDCLPRGFGRQASLPSGYRPIATHLLEALDEPLVVHGARVGLVLTLGRRGLLLGGGGLDVVGGAASGEEADDPVADGVTDGDTRGGWEMTWDR